MASGTNLALSRLLLSVALLWILCSATSAHAQTGIDFHGGPLLTSSGITGFGGAYTAIAEGVEGYFRNPASIANRNASATGFLDLGFTLDLQTTTNDAIDFDNDGDTLPDASARSITAGARVALGPFALGAVYTQRRFSASGNPATPMPLDASFTIEELAGTAGLSLLEGALITGVGIGARWLALDPGNVEAEANSLFADFGVLYRPVYSNLRVGGRVRLPSNVGAKISNGARIATARYPWEANVGVAYMVPFGDRVWNETIGGWEGWGAKRTFHDNRHVTFSLDLVADGAVDDAVNPEGFLCGDPTCARRSGDKMSLAAHVGIESEIIHDRFRLRVGSYSEPDRVANKLDGRLHITGGADLRLFTIWILPIKVGVAFDLAPRYSNIQLGLGFWT